MTGLRDPKPCRVCGTLFVPTGGGASMTKVCSAACRKADLAARRRAVRAKETLLCAVCESPFVTSRLTGFNRPKTCPAAECRRQFYNARQKARKVRLRATRPRPLCRQCQRPFDKTAPCQYYCSPACQTASENAAVMASRRQLMLADPAAYHEQQARYHDNRRERLRSDPAYRAVVLGRKRVADARRCRRDRELANLRGLAELQRLAAGRADGAGSA